MKKQNFCSCIRLFTQSMLKGCLLQTTVLSIALLGIIPDFLQADPPANQSHQQGVEVGKVLSSTGKVWIDAFGNNEFVPVIQGDFLYEKSILRTDDNSQAVIILGQQSRTIPARTLFVVKEIIATESKAQSIKWFQDIKEILEAALNQLLSGEESTALGSRGTDNGPSKKIFKLVEDNQLDIDALQTAKQKMEEKHYAEAITSLQSVRAPEKLGFYPGEFAYLKGACYFQLHSFPKAREELLVAYQSIQNQLTQKGFKPYFVMPLIFQLASTYYLLNDEKTAIVYFQKMLALAEDHSSKSYAYLFVIRYYLDAGQKDKVNEYTKALELYLEKKEERNEILKYIKG